MRREKQLIICQIIGVSIFIFIAMILTMLQSRYMLSKYINETVLEWMISGILLLSSVITNMAIIKIINEKNLSASILNASLIIAILFIIGSLIDGPFQNAILRIGAILAGTIISYVILPQRHGKRRTHKRHNR